jgi:hypothetical protein
MTNQGIQFKSWRLKGMPFFKDQSFDLSYVGTSLVLGKNLDSSNDNPNGAGKSMFFSELAEFLIDEQIIGERKDLVRSGTRELTFTRGKHEYFVTRSFSPKEKITIARDGKELEYRELSAAKAALAALIPFSKQEVLSLFHIDSRVPHPLTRGSAASRREFFLRFFRMSAAPHMRKVVKAELDEVKSAEIVLKEVKGRIAELKASLAGRELDTLRKSLKQEKERVVGLELSVRRYLKLKSVEESYENFKATFAELKDLAVYNNSAAKSLKADCDAKLRSIAVDLNKWEEYEAYLENEAASRKKHAKLLDRVPKEYQDDPKSHLKEIANELVELREKMASRQESLTAAQGEVSEIKENLSSQESKLRVVESDIEEIKLAPSKCPTCGSKLDKTHSDKELESLAEKQKELKKRVKELRAALEVAVAGRDKRRSKLDTSEQKLQELQDTHDNLRKLLDFSSEAASVKKPKTSVEELSASQKTISLTLNTLANAENAFRCKDEYKALSEEDKELLARTDLTDQLMNANQRIGELRVSLDDVKIATEDLAKLRVRKKELVEKRDSRAPLELLYEAFSKKGVEAVMIQTITDRLSTLVNKYARLLFPEDYTFSFDLKSQFSFLVTRKYGKKEVVSDVRKLSGAESLLFNLILYVALLAFVPIKNRCNLLILDEPTSNMGPEMIEAFVKFLPILNSLVPHIIVITPMPHSDYPNTKIWTVVKKNGVSKFYPGRYQTKKASNDKVGNYTTTNATRIKSHSR